MFFSIALRFVCMSCWGVDHFQGGAERGEITAGRSGGKSAAQIRKRHEDGQRGGGGGAMLTGLEKATLHGDESQIETNRDLTAWQEGGGANPKSSARLVS